MLQQQQPEDQQQQTSWDCLAVILFYRDKQKNSQTLSCLMCWTCWTPAQTHSLITAEYHDVTEKLTNDLSVASSFYPVGLLCVIYLESAHESWDDGRFISESKRTFVPKLKKFPRAVSRHSCIIRCRRISRNIPVQIPMRLYVLTLIKSQYVCFPVVFKYSHNPLKWSFSSICFRNALEPFSAAIV